MNLNDEQHINGPSDLNACWFDGQMQSGTGMSFEELLGQGPFDYEQYFPQPAADYSPPEQASAEYVPDDRHSTEQVPRNQPALEYPPPELSSAEYILDDQDVVEQTPGNSPLLFIRTSEALNSSLPQHQGKYRNQILNEFNSPEVPLSVIDSHYWLHLNQKLQLALEQELEAGRQPQTFNTNFDAQIQQSDMNDSATWGVAGSQHDLADIETLNYIQAYQPRHSNLPSSPVEIDKPQSTEQRARTNKRQQNRENLDPTKFYKPLTEPLESWGPKDSRGQHIFRYTEKGELDPFSVFTNKDIKHFIEEHPLKNEDNGKNSGLIMWIQSVPSDSKRRYGHPFSSKCRFKDCPNPQRTINKGDFRVAFDEHSHRVLPNTVHDPFHVAGYVHLYCLEKFIDFPRIAKYYNVKPDTRHFPEGKSKMALIRDHVGMLCVANDYILNHSWGHEGDKVIRPDDWFKKSLTYALTKKHLEMQPVAKKIDREERGSSNSIEKHMNDLDLYMANRDERYRHRKSLGRTSAVAPLSIAAKAPKRKIEEVEDEDEGVLDDDILRSVSPPKKVRVGDASGNHHFPSSYPQQPFQ